MCPPPPRVYYLPGCVTAEVLVEFVLMRRADSVRLLLGAGVSVSEPYFDRDSIVLPNQL